MLGREWLVLLGCAALGASVQIQTTLNIGGSAIRVSLSDIVALLLLPAAAFLFAKNVPVFRQRLEPAIGALAVAATMVIGYGFAIGAWRLGHIESWAVVKAVGWLSLVYYGVLGLAFVVTFQQTAPKVLAVSFLGTAAVLLAIHSVFFALASDWIGSYAYRYQGFLDNPNAQGFVLLCALSICLAGQRQLGAWIGEWQRDLLTGFLLAGIIHASSLAAVGSTIIVLLVHLLARPPGIRPFLRVCVFAVLAIGLSIGARSASVGTVSKFVRTGLHDLSDKFGYVIGPILSQEDQEALDPSKARDFSIQVRWESYVKAFEEWTEAPLFGRGLGTHLADNRKSSDKGRPAQQIHNTGLWILSEMGLVGLVVFGGLCGVLVHRFWRTYASARESDPDASDTMYAMLLILLGWLVMSMAHELLYQRVLWLALGATLGVSLRVAPRAR